MRVQVNDIILELDSDNRVVDIDISDKSIESKVIFMLKGEVIDIDFNRGYGIYELLNCQYFYEIRTIKKTSFVFMSKRVMNSLMMESALNCVEEGIQIYNRQGYNTYLNNISEQMSGICKEDFVGEHLVDLYNLDEEFSTVLTTIRTEEPTTDRCDYFQTKDNKAMVTINSGFPFFYDNQLYGVVLTENSVDTINKQAHKKLYLNEYLQKAHAVRDRAKYFQFKDIIYQSSNMEELINVAKKISLNSSSVLIYGDTGTGKELLAQSIHSFGASSDKPFVAVNCAAIPDSLAESLFFGTVKGAYTGSENTEGFFAQANGGTLFLDEVNSMSLDMQSKLLRTLQNKTYRRIGDRKEYPFNARIITASNENLKELIAKKTFRSDFYFRISTITLNLPSLVDRIEDIPLLTKHFINKHNKKYMRDVKGVSPSVEAILLRYHWIGNIRELENVIEYAFALIPDGVEVIEIDHLPTYLRLNSEHRYKLENDIVKRYDVPISFDEPLEDRINDYEKWLIENYLMVNGWHITKTAKILGLKRQSLQYRIKKHGIEKKKAK